MPKARAATFAVWNGGGLFAGSASGSTAVHAHYAAQLTVAPAPGLRLRGDGRALWQAYRAAFVPSGVPHALDVSGVPAWAVVFVGPETREERALAARWPEGGIMEVGPDETGAAAERLFAAWRAGDRGGVVAAGRALAADLAGDLPDVSPPDERVERAIASIERGLGGALALPEVARAVHLSPSRLRHLLVEQTGAGFRAHVRWRRLLRAWALVGAGATLTEAAHAAGFSDSAHLSRTVRRTFGLTPSVVSAALQTAAQPR